MNIIINPQHIERSKWSDFISSNAEGNIFQTPEMYDVYKNTKHYEPVFVCITNDEQNIEALLLAVIQSEGQGVKKLLTARSIIFGGPIYNKYNLEALQLCLEQYQKQISRKAIYSQFRNFSIQNAEVQHVFKHAGFNYEPHLNILLPVFADENIMWKGIKRNRKDGINKAKKAGFDFSVNHPESDISEFYSLTTLLFQKIKLPYPDINFFENIQKYVSPNVHRFSLTYNNKTVIELFALSYKTVLYAFYIGISQDKNFEKQRPVDLFYWEIIRWCSSNGIETFDWMGAGKPDQDYGVRDFKLQFGGELSNMGRYVQIHKPLFMLTGKAGLYLWKKLKK